MTIQKEDFWNLNDRYCFNCAAEIVGELKGRWLYNEADFCIGYFNDALELFDCEQHYIGELVSIKYEANKNGASINPKVIAEGVTLKNLSNESERNKYTDLRLVVNPCKKSNVDEKYTCCAKSETKIWFDKQIKLTVHKAPEGYEDFKI